MDRIPLGKLAEKLDKFLWCEYGSIRWDQYWFLKGCSKELHKAAIYYDEQTECTKTSLIKCKKGVSEMTCPYCDSSDWDSESPFFRFEERSVGIWAYRNCTCQKCGKTFIMRERYTNKDYDYECMSIEEFKQRIGE